MRIFLSASILILALFPISGQQESLVIENSITGLTVSGNIHLELIKSTSQKLEYTLKKNAEEIDININNGNLSLKTRTELTSKTEATRVKLFYNDISFLEVLKGARVQSGDTVKTGNLTLEVENGGKVQLMIHVDSLSSRVNQGADIILFGFTGSQFIQAYTWGNFLGYDLMSDNTYIKAATGAQVKVTVTGFLDANATSKAFIGYAGEPAEKKIKTSVGGEITPYYP